MRKPLLIFSSFALLLTFFSFLFLAGCQKDIDGSGGPGGSGNTGGGPDNVKVVAGVRGVVIDENGQPVQGAMVTSGNNTTTTDRYGVFRFSNISLAKENGYVKVSKPGYFTGNRCFVTSAGRTHNLRIRLLPKNNSGSFPASSGGTVSLASGGKITLPANAITDAGGAAYSGTVNIAMTWIDPAAANLPEIMVGDLRGITTTGEERGLQTFGMLGVEMTSPGGQTLKIAAGKTAGLTFPIPPLLQSGAPSTIDLWHFDETKGRWMQEGTAVKTGNTYVAQVSHFSFWNCDAPFPLVELCMTLLNSANNQPLNNVQVRITRPNASYSCGFTDSVGNLCGKVPKNETLILDVLSVCGTVVYTQTIGPFSSNTSLGNLPINLSGPNTLVINGTLVNCSNNNVTNGSMVIYTDNAHSYTVPVTNGSFSLTVIRCGSTPMNFAIRGIDLSTLKESNMFNGTGTSGSIHVGNIQACGNLSEYIEYIVDGVPYTWVDLGYPQDINAYDSIAAGSYSHKTGLFASKFVGPNWLDNTYFYFLNNQAPGVYPLVPGPFDVKLTDGNWLLREFVSPNPTVTITAFGAAPGGFIEGNFSVQMKTGTSPIYNVICNFKVKR